MAEKPARFIALSDKLGFNKWSWRGSPPPTMKIGQILLPTAYYENFHDKKTGSGNQNGFQNRFAFPGRSK
jgi:hypothetical protein